ncbi:MAG: serine/threonine-protein kinase [Thermoanaerobaculia bacterium]
MAVQSDAVPANGGSADADGLIFDQYQVERTLGRGAMGIVYLARDLRIGRLVALKTLPRARQFDSTAAEEAFLRRFRREAELCGSLLHPNVVALYDVGWEGRRISYLAMEYVEGESLLSLLQREGKLPLDAAVGIASDVLTGLAFAHGRGVIHRDIKPANVLVTVEGRAKIADFGVARWARDGGAATLTAKSEIIGTPYYMSPEMISSQRITAVSDLFSVGVLLYEMLTEKKPFEAPSVPDILYEIVHTPAPDLGVERADTPPWLRAYVRRLLAKDPAERFPSAAEANRELRRLARVGDFDTSPGLTLPRAVPVVSNLSPEDTPTTPITIEGPFRRALRRLDTAVPTPLGIAIVAVVAALLLVPVALLQRELEATDTAIAAATAAEEVVSRRATLREARLLFEAGSYEESLVLYREYLGQYPWSEAARDGERAVLEVLEAKRAEHERREMEAKERFWRALQARRERDMQAATASSMAAQ